MMKRQTGFTLIELAMVLFILSLLVGGLLIPLATQLEGRQRNETGAQLEEIIESLIGFAIINGRLPCYTTETDPTSPDYGLEDSVCNPAGLAADGILPWRTLGLPARDPWGRERTGAADPWDGFWRYRVDSNFFTTFTLATDPAAGSDMRVDELDITNSAAGAPAFNPLTAATEPPVAIIYSTGSNLVGDGLNADYEQTSADGPTYEGGVKNGIDRDGDGDLEDDEYDDILVWLSRPLLFNRMVAAGRLP